MLATVRTEQDLRLAMVEHHVLQRHDETPALERPHRYRVIRMVNRPDGRVLKLFQLARFRQFTAITAVPISNGSWMMAFARVLASWS